MNNFINPLISVVKRLFYMGITLVLIGCTNCPNSPALDTPCFQSIINKLTDDPIKEIDMALEINCFQWDSLEIGGRGSYLDYDCLNFTLIEIGKYSENGIVVKGNKLESKMDWFDRDRHWQMIYFYHNDQILNEALAISQSAVSFTDMTRGQYNIFIDKAASKFQISDRILGGTAGTSLIKHRQIMKK